VRRRVVRRLVLDQLRRQLARQRFDLACELALLFGQLQGASRDGAQREQAAAQLWITSAVWPRCREPLHQPRACPGPQLAAPRFGGCDQQVAQLAESGPFGVDCAFACGGQGLQRLAFTAGPRGRRPLLGEHAAGRPDSVERVGPAARAPLAAQPAHLEYPLTAAVRKRVSPAPNEPVPSTANARRAPACSSTSSSASA
jgi:hypothetical protein